MIISELIHHLQAFHPDAEVRLSTFNMPDLPDGWWADHEIEQVESEGMYNVRIVAES